LALYWAYSPPPLITEFYTAAVGLLSAALFVPTIAGLWWKGANLSGGLASLVTGAATYLALSFSPVRLPLAPILIALPASAAAMILGSLLGPAEREEMLGEIARLHAEETA
jgi:sodium/pantothenate symporter